MLDDGRILADGPLSYEYLAICSSTVAAKQRRTLEQGIEVLSFKVYRVAEAVAEHTTLADEFHHSGAIMFDS